MLTRSKLVRYLFIPVAAILAFWWGGFFYFKSSSDWEDVQTLLAHSPEIRALVGEVKRISVDPLPFTYRFSGDYAQATLKVTLTGTNGEFQRTIDLEKRSGSWVLVK